MNNFNLSQDKINALLGMAGQKLGKSPEEIKSELEGGNGQSLINSLDPGTAKQVNSVLSNPKAMEALMKNDQVKKLLAGLMGGQGK